MVNPFHHARTHAETATIGRIRLMLGKMFILIYIYLYIYMCLNLYEDKNYENLCIHVYVYIRILLTYTCKNSYNRSHSSNVR
jgi:hypothetical protein